MDLQILFNRSIVKSAFFQSQRRGTPNGSGEVKIFFKNDKDLAFILERIEDIKFNQKNKNNDKSYWDLLT